LFAKFIPKEFKNDKYLLNLLKK